MKYKTGDILLIRFPFTDLSNTKKRPVILIQDENDRGDFICFQITSKTTQDSLIEIQPNHLSNGKLKLKSNVKYDKCFTLNSSIIDKKLATANNYFMTNLKELFCRQIF